MTIEPNSGREEVDALRQENAELRERLSRATVEADLYKRGVYEMIDKFEPETPMSDEEIDEILNAPQDQQIRAIIAEYEAKLKG